MAKKTILRNAEPLIWTGGQCLIAGSKGTTESAV